MKTLKQLIESKSWTNHGSNEYSTEASDLGTNRTAKRNICPKCGKEFSKSDLTKTLKQNAGTEDEETAGWEFKHNCGAKLTIWND